jgi:hypothetical protein
MATKAEVAAKQRQEAERKIQAAAAQAKVTSAQTKLATYGSQANIDFTKAVAPKFSKMAEIAGRVTAKAATKPEVLKAQGITLDQLKEKTATVQAGATKYTADATGITQAEEELATAQGLVTQYSTPIDIPTLTKTPNVAYDTIGKILENYRITDIASVLEDIRDEYPEASSEEVLTLLQFDSRYNAKFNARFAANQERLKAGKSVLSPGEYLKLEQGYQKIFNAYNLPTFKTQTYYDTFITADLDLDEVTDRVQLGYDRVLNDQAVQSTFNKFFSALGFSDIVTGMLDTKNQLPALERKVKAAEIGGAAFRQGLVASQLAATEAQANVGYTNVSRGTVGADVLAGQGLTKAQAEAGYTKIAQLLPTAEKLSSIYGGTEDQYGRLEAEQEQLQGLASAARKRQRLAELETAQFRKDSGLGKGALSSITNV